MQLSATPLPVLKRKTQPTAELVIQNLAAQGRSVYKGSYKIGCIYTETRLVRIAPQIYQLEDEMRRVSAQPQKLGETSLVKARKMLETLRPRFISELRKAGFIRTIVGDAELWRAPAVLAS